MKRDLRPELAGEVELPPDTAAQAAKHTAESLIGAPPPQPVSELADPLAVDNERFRRAAAAYNQERAAAYQTYKMAFDAAWTVYHATMRQANEEYETAVNAAAAHYDLMMVRDAQK